LVLNLEQGKLGFDSTTTTALYRMVQEALTNVARHARATQATITLACTDAECVVSIRDNGQGLSTESGAKPESFGLVGMRERARLLGGHVRIQSVPGQGTTVEIRVPISTAKIIQENA
jgi:signal transduction histidine kinase